jgi:hypothetical protein
VSIVGQTEDGVNKRNRRFLSILLCAAFTAIAACSTTPAYMPIGEDSIYGITKGDRVPVRWTAGGEREMVWITSVSETGFVGTGDRGRRVAADYGELYEIGRKPKVDRRYEPPTKAQRVAADVLMAVAGTMFVAAGVAVCAGAPVVCLELLADIGGEP